jgi:hypothetical protein
MHSQSVSLNWSDPSSKRRWSNAAATRLVLVWSPTAQDDDRMPVFAVSPTATLRAPDRAGERGAPTSYEIDSEILVSSGACR